MSEHFDRYETRTPQSRETALLRDLRGIVSVARSRAPGLRQQLRGIEISSIKRRADLAAVPVIRKEDLPSLQAETPPFGGLVATRLGALKRLLVSPGMIFEPEGHAKDWWGAARAMYAAGFRKGDLVHNSFSYHLTPGGHVMESGAHALGCTVIPAGTAPVEQQIAVIARARPKAYAGTPDFLKILLDKAAESKSDVSSLKQALVSGAALPASLRRDLEARGLSVQQCYATADLGVVAYETRDAEGKLIDGLVVNEGVLLEIVRPGTGDPVPVGEVGEIVVTRLNADYPLLRFATGDLSALIPEPSPCGRTNMRIRGWLGRADQTTKVKGMFVHPAQVAAIGRQVSGLGRLRLVVTRADERDRMVLHAEAPDGDASLGAKLTEALQVATNLHGDVKIVPPGSLPNDGKVIADERPVS
jgi:phenylacetate-CoA ligase